jgi:tyrosine-protein phosphatase SIW14
MPSPRLTLVILLLAALALSARAGQMDSLEVQAQSAIVRFRAVDTGIFAGGRPKEAGVKILAGMGVKTVVDLESGWFISATDPVRAERRWVEAAGLTFLQVPMHPLFTPTRPEIDQALALLTDSTRQPIYLHCNHGKDRTGMVIGFYRVKYQGWTPEQAYREMLKNGFSGFWLFPWKSFFFKQTEGLQAVRKAA